MDIRSNGMLRLSKNGTNTSTGGDRSDDHLWSIFSVCNYIKETGDKEIYK